MDVAFRAMPLWDKNDNSGPLIRIQRPLCEYAIRNAHLAMCTRRTQKKTMSTLAPQDLCTHKHAQTTRQTRWRSRVPTLVTNTRTHLKPIETQAAETPVWVRGGKVVRVRPRLKDECMTDWEIALNHFPAIRIDPSGIHHDN